MWCGDATGVVVVKRRSLRQLERLHLHELGSGGGRHATTSNWPALLTFKVDKVHPFYLSLPASQTQSSPITCLQNFSDFKRLVKVNMPVSGGLMIRRVWQGTLLRLTPMLADLMSRCSPSTLPRQPSRDVVFHRCLLCRRLINEIGLPQPQQS